MSACSTPQATATQPSFSTYHSHETPRTPEESRHLRPGAPTCARTTPRIRDHAIFVGHANDNIVTHTFPAWNIHGAERTQTLTNDGKGRSHGSPTGTCKPPSPPRG